MHHQPATGTGSKQILGAIPPASGAVVMGTGIVSIALSLDRQETLSRILLLFAAVAWLALGLLLAGARCADRERVAPRCAIASRADRRRRHRRARHPPHPARLGLGRDRAARDRAAFWLVPAHTGADPLGQPRPSACRSS